jgi:lysophospholipid acyltransferase 1/2
MARPESDLTPEQKRYAVKSRPSPLQFFSYMFQFQPLLCGPLVYYNDYTDFIEGRNFDKHLEAGESRPSPVRRVIDKMATSVAMVLLLLFVAPKFPVTPLGESEFLWTSSFLQVMVYMVVATSMTRLRYYHAWKLGESICNASGLGFEGFTPHREAKWDMVSNVNIWRVETSLSMRGSLEEWNKTTQHWLKSYAYERAPSKYKTLLTYGLSAVWHGFYPGYYLTFATAALGTFAARTVRRSVRPLFQANSSLAFGYDVLTFTATRLIMAYLIVPFHVLSLRESITFFSRVYFCGHILCILAIVLVPKVFPQKREPKPKSS